MSEHCRCGHVRGAHYVVQVSSGSLHSKSERLTFDDYRCHGKDCHCRTFTEDTRLWSRFKRWVGQR